MIGIEIVGFVVSPGHAYEGRPGDGPVAVPTSTPDSLEIRAGHGVVGDRYAGRAAHREAAVTVLAIEALEAAAAELGVPPFDPAAARRTILTRGLDVEALRGRESPSTRATDRSSSVAAGPRRRAPGWTSSSPRAPTRRCAGAPGFAARPWARARCGWVRRP